METGIIGLPNVGKSSLFNALTNAGAASSNYPFTTIDPNVGVVPLPDRRLDRLFEIFKPPKKTAAPLRFVDIAGLVKGASKGEGLGNKFLANIREVDAVIHVVRLFQDDNVIHVMGGVDPARDVEIIETELMLADLETVEKMIPRLEGQCRAGDKTARTALETLKRVQAVLAAGKPASSLGLAPEETAQLQLLTLKPTLFVGNNSEKPNAGASKILSGLAAARGAGFVELCVKVEAELAELGEDERRAFLAESGEHYTGLEKVARASQKLMGLISFFTAGEEIEVRSWLIPEGFPAPRAAGKIHSDIERGFIRAEVYSFEDIDRHGSEKTLREKGLIRSEGRDYNIKDGDVCLFRFNV
ncbi:MAG: redox-regulated ATPase YchF [Elusimicrobiales bacterium]